MMSIQISSEELVRNISAYDVLNYMDEYELSTLVRDYINKNMLNKIQQQSIQGLLHLLTLHAEEIRSNCLQDDIDALIEELTK